MQANGWQIFYHRVFQAALGELERTVKQLAQSDPQGYKSHPKTKLLASIFKAIREKVPANPQAPEFRLGKTLDTTAASNAHWRRVKKGLPSRYRLFFRFASSPIQLIVYVWFNDENSLRKAGSKTDVYETFGRMLAKGIVPQSIEQLLAQAQS
jgi:toxin YhaV